MRFLAEVAGAVQRRHVDSLQLFGRRGAGDHERGRQRDEIPALARRHQPADDRHQPDARRRALTRARARRVSTALGKPQFRLVRDLTRTR